MKQPYHIRPIMPVDKETGKVKRGRFGRNALVKSYSRKEQARVPVVIMAHSPEDAIKAAVVKGHIPSNTVMQYYEAVAA